MKRLFIYMSYITLLLTAVLFSYLIYLSFYPFQIVDLNKFEVTQEQVKRGDYVQYELDFKKNHNFISETRYYFVDGIIIRLEGSGIQRHIGTQQVTRLRQIPKTIVPGKYKMRIELDYKITAWRTISYIWESEYFEIL